MHPVLIGSFRTDDESVLASADVCRFVAESEAEEWSLRVWHARETEDAAQDFCAERSERTAIILLGKALAAFCEAPKSLSCEHLMCVAAAHIAESDHPMAKGMAAVPTLTKNEAVGKAAVTAILQVWDAWMATQVDPERSADELMALDELEVREM